MVKQISDIRDLRAALLGQASVGFVPTMGALHAGHMALMQRARAENDLLVASIFVNPLQFGAGEDLDAYPRPLAQDKAMLEAAGVDVLFTPTPDEMYPQGFATRVHVADLGERLCGESRKGHFDGVCTVVAKLLNVVQPERAYFGEKDWQQLTIIRRMAADLALQVNIIAVPTLREADGLAMSSRNVYLSPQERAIAPVLHQTLRACADALRGGAPAAEVLHTGKAALLEKGFASVDYLALCDEQSLAPLSALQPNARLFVAARLGKARLIDNVEI